MNRIAWVSAAMMVVVGCIDFDGKLESCHRGAGVCSAFDAGHDGGSIVDAGASNDGGGVDGGDALACPGFSYNGFCWVNPTPNGEEYLAVTGSENDLWVAGTAGTVMHWDGQRWDDRRLLETLGPDRIDSHAVTGLAPIDGGIIVVGRAIWPHVWRNGAWVKLYGSPTLHPSFNAVAVDEQGQYMAVGVGEQGGFTATGLLEAGNQPTLTNAASFLAFENVVALPGAGGFVKTANLANGHAFIAANGSVVFTYFDPAGYDHHDWGLSALFLDGFSSVWCGGDYGVTGVYDISSGVFSPGHAGVSESLIAGAVLGDRLMFLGNNDIFLEGSRQATLDGGLTPLAVHDVIHPTTWNHAVVTSPSGWALAVGPGGQRFKRTPGSFPLWSMEGSRLKANIVGALAIDGGILFYGEGETFGTVYADSLVPRYQQGAPGSDGIDAVWIDGNNVWVSRRRGELCLRTTNGCTLQSRVSEGYVTVMAGRSAANAWAFGGEGQVARLRDAGWVNANIDAGGAPFTAASPMGDDVMAFSTLSNE